MIKIFLLVIFVLFNSLLAQEENVLEKEEASEKPVQNKTDSNPGMEEPHEKKYSVQIILGRGSGHLNVINDKYDPTTSMSEFVALSLFGASLASTNYSSALTGNLNSSSLIALFLLNDEISTNYVSSNSSSAFNRYYLENRSKNDSVGFQFGLSNGQYAFKADNTRAMASFIPTPFFGTTNPIMNIYMLQSYLKNSEPINIAIDTFDFALKFHFFPENTFDPYLSIGSGVGSCYTDCYALRFFGRAGIRFNFNDYYAFLEEEMQMVLFSTSIKKFSPLQERIHLVGFGFYL